MRVRSTWLLLFLTTSTGCDDSTIGTGGSTSATTSTTASSGSGSSSSTGGGPPATPATKVDVVLAIDNSRSMDDKQAILAMTLPDLIGGFTNPPCVDASGALAATQPASPTDACPDASTHRISAPITDLHVGVVTSSLGGHGSDACHAVDTNSCAGGATNTSNDDHGHLLSRVDPCAGGAVPTYQDQGFLAWDPAQKLSPPGSSSLGELSISQTSWVTSTKTPGLVPTLRDLVVGSGSIGCGYESQLESWYRFLADPEPYATIEPNASLQAVPMGIDDALLAQRKAFLRSDSALVVVQLTDENDCSTKETGQFWLSNQQRDPGNPSKNFFLPRARSECATNPNDPCCRSCGQDQTGCPADPACAAPNDSKSDPVNLRCWDQKRRFGIDFLYPVERYADVLSKTTVKDRAGADVVNPIFSDLDPSDGVTTVRSTSQVFYAAIVGVPWQDIAKDPADATKGWKTTDEIGWGVVIGDPSNHVAPSDPHMIESNAPRSGSNPITGTAIAPPTAPAGANPINGHEYTPGTENGLQTAADDLEYACIFPLAQPKDCSQAAIACDCGDPLNDNPLCSPDPSQGGARTLQTATKAYPGIRQLSVVRLLGDQGIAGSVCAVQTTDPTRADFAFRPSVFALLRAVAPALAQP